MPAREGVPHYKFEAVQQIPQRKRQKQADYHIRLQMVERKTRADRRKYYISQVGQKKCEDYPEKGVVEIPLVFIAIDGDPQDNREKIVCGIKQLADLREDRIYHPLHPYGRVDTEDEIVQLYQDGIDVMGIYSRDQKCEFSVDYEDYSNRIPVSDMAEDFYIGSRIGDQAEGDNKEDNKKVDGEEKSQATVETARGEDKHAQNRYEYKTCQFSRAEYQKKSLDLGHRSNVFTSKKIRYLNGGD